MSARLTSDDAELGRPPGYSGNQVRAVLRWLALLPLALVAASLLVLGRTLFGADQYPIVRSAFWPGSGSARDVARHGLDVLLMSGNSVLLSWLVFLDLLCRRFLAPEKELRRQIALMAGSAVILATLGAIGLGSRYRHEETWFFFLLLCAPTLTLCYGLLWTGLRQWQRLGLGGLILAAFPALTIFFQRRFGNPRGGEPDESAFVYCSLLIGLAIAVRLGIWCWAEARVSQQRRT